VVLQRVPRSVAARRRICGPARALQPVPRAQPPQPVRPELSRSGRTHDREAVERNSVEVAARAPRRHPAEAGIQVLFRPVIPARSWNDDYLAVTAPAALSAA